MKNSFEGYDKPSTNYDSINPVDGSLEHPNKYALLEKRNEYIDEALELVLYNQKADVFKRPAVGFVTLVERVLRRKAGLNEQILSTTKEAEYEAEFGRDIVRKRICEYFEVKDADYAALEGKIEEYYKK